MHTREAAVTTDNLNIWNAVKKTDTRFVKEANVGGRKTASINHIEMVEKATKLWGPIGIGWGYEILEERDDQGAPAILEGQVVGHNITHTLKLRLWYVIGGNRGSVENYGHTPRIYWSRKNSSFVQDDEAAKKSLSDALKKCFSFLGFSADIYGGEWDDPEYRQERHMESQIEKAEDRDAERDRQREELTEYVKKHLATLDTAKSSHEAAGIYRTAARHLDRQKHMPHLTDIAERGVASIARAYESKKQGATQ